MEFSRPEFWSGLDFPFPRGSSPPRNQTRVSCVVGGFFTNRPIREALILRMGRKISINLPHFASLFSLFLFQNQTGKISQPEALEGCWRWRQLHHPGQNPPTTTPFTPDSELTYNNLFRGIILIAILQIGKWRFGRIHMARACGSCRG